MTENKHWLSQIKLCEWFYNAQYYYRPRNDKERNLMHGCYEEGYNNGFSDGLAEGKLKWHDLRKDPNDLPKREELSDQSIIVLNQNGYNVRYDFNLKYWHFLNDDEARVIAWCELPKFEE